MLRKGANPLDCRALPLQQGVRKAHIGVRKAHMRGEGEALWVGGQPLPPRPEFKAHKCANIAHNANPLVITHTYTTLFALHIPTLCTPILYHHH